MKLYKIGKSVIDNKGLYATKNIKKAYKLVYRKNLKIEEALLELSSLFEQTQDIHIENFIKSIQASERGILR